MAHACELHVATTLAIGAIISIAVYVTTGRHGRVILLPVSASNEDVAEEADSASTDPETLRIAKPEDLIDGIPLDEDAFWAKVRVLKLGLMAILILMVVTEGAYMGFSCSLAKPWITAASALRLCLAAYLLVLSARSIRDEHIETHWATVIHLSVLTTLATSLLAILTILPSPAGMVNLGNETDWNLAILQYTNLTLYLSAAVISCTIGRGPPLHFPMERIYGPKARARSANLPLTNVCGIVQSSVFGVLLYTYVTSVALLGYTKESLNIEDLPLVPADMRAITQYMHMRVATRIFRLPGTRTPGPGRGWDLIYRVIRVNGVAFLIESGLSVTIALLCYVRVLFVNRLIFYLEEDPGRDNLAWGLVYCGGLFLSNAVLELIYGQLWGLTMTTIQTRIRVQLNATLFAKSLVRKDMTFTSEPSSSSTAGDTVQSTDEPQTHRDQDFSSKAQIMTLMTTDVDRVGMLPWHWFCLIDAPVELLVATVFIYRLLGISGLVGILASVGIMPLTRYASKIVKLVQDSLMKSRDQRISLMNELLRAIRTVKFMAWERSSEERVMAIRRKELHYQRLTYLLEISFNAIWSASPVVVTLVALWHFTVIRSEILTPSLAFTTVALFNELRFALNTLPETFINLAQMWVSLKRIETYLLSPEISSHLSSAEPGIVSFKSASISWPQYSRQSVGTPSTAVPSFILKDITVTFPQGKLSLICGKLGSGKTLLLLALLGEADVLAGGVTCPRTHPDFLDISADLSHIPDDEWTISDAVAYVPQSAWLQNLSIRDNILFNLPFKEGRYQQTLEACALIPDLEALEGGDKCEVGERGVKLSGGQKARISLARAVYSRASILLLDDVLSAVDAHTAHHLYQECLNGDILRGRTVILVSHQVQLCLPAVAYVVALENKQLRYAGEPEGFRDAGLIHGVEETQSSLSEKHVAEITSISIVQGAAAEDQHDEGFVESLALNGKAEKPKEATDRDLAEDENRAVGRIERKVWLLYIHACGGYLYRITFLGVVGLGALTPVAEKGWLRYWSAIGSSGASTHGTAFYLIGYALICAATLIFTSLRLVVIYQGGLHAAGLLHERLLRSILSAKIRFHDTVSTGRVLNRFGKDIEVLDSSLPDNFGRAIIDAFSILTTLIAVTYVGGLLFLGASLLLGVLFYNVGKLYGQTARDMRRLDSVTRSPLYTAYGDNLSGVTVIRAFGASTKALRDMLALVDTNISAVYWMWSVGRWVSLRFSLLSSTLVGITGLTILLNKGIDASFAGFALAFVESMMNDMLMFTRGFVSLEQTMVALERINEFSEIEQEPAQIHDPGAPPDWPTGGNIEVKNLVIRYAPELPNVLHGLTFSVSAGEKIGILGRTGCGKSTLALSFFRFVEPVEGTIFIDGLDITKIALANLRSKLTIIPQDPSIFSGTLRSTLDIFNEYADHELYEALRRVHLLDSGQQSDEQPEDAHTGVFSNLDTPVAEGGENFSAGEKQLICMARAILRRSKVLIMDEATASVDYATDQLIAKTVREEFAKSTVLTIAHRLRTVIDYDKVLVLDQGRIAEFDTPSTLLADSSSMFYSLCKSAGTAEFDVLKRMAGEAEIARTAPSSSRS